MPQPTTAKNAQAAYDKALKRIEACRKTRDITLDLSEFGLIALPPEIGQLTALVGLILRENLLTTLPPEIGQLTNLEILDLRNNQLRALPPEIGQLVALKNLIVSANQLSTLPPEIGRLVALSQLEAYANEIGMLPSEIFQLAALTHLTLSGNRLSTLPPEIGQFAALTELELSGNGLNTLPPEIFQLSALTQLDLSDNRLDTLLPEIGKLTALKELSLSNNQLRSLPSEIGQLTALKGFSVNDNQLSSLPPEIGRLTSVPRLLLHNNQLRSLPPEIGQLITLECLYVDNNRLTTVPLEICRLKALKDLDLSGNKLVALPFEMGQLTALEGLYLHRNPDLALPTEILGPTWEKVAETDDEPASPQAILAFYFGQQKRGAKPLNEVKLLLVGHGRVGKTSLSKALRDVRHNEKEPETPGIERHPLTLLAGKTMITAHVWDFGGQEFLHQTHQFFFSERSIYVVVLAGRDRSLMQRSPVQEAEYWLRLIRTYGTGSPVVIVLNKFKAHEFSVDEFDLKDRYPEVKAVVKADCDPRFKIADLRRLLGTLAGKMPGVREKIDPAWAKVRTELEKMGESFVSYAGYQEICRAQGVATPEKQETLAIILNCLGIALNYRNDPRLRDTSVLKPRWLVDGIYAILRWLQKKERNGELRKGDFAKALRDKKVYPPEKHGFLQNLMEKFELCFPLDGKDGAYLVPGLLDENQPRELKLFMSQEARRIQFRYDDVRPPGLLPQFIVRSHTLSVRQPRWLRGVVLARGKARALVRADHDGRVTDVFALGENTEDRVWLTEFIVAEMKALHDKLPVHTLVESEDEPGAWTELEILREADRKGQITRSERTADRGNVTVKVNKVLRDVESQEASTPNANPLPLFICYAHANERLVKRLVPSLKIMARRGYIEAWRDTDLVPGEDWDETIKERLAKSKVILFMVSRDFLASKYITEQERPLAMQLKKNKKAVVVPVLLSPCGWRDEDFAALEKLPRKDDPVSAINPREEAWALVEEGLKKVINAMRPERTEERPRHKVAMG